MKRNDHYLSIALGALITLSGCDGGSQSNQATTSNQSSSGQSATSSSQNVAAIGLTYATNAGKSDWPNIGQEAQGIADNILSKNYYVILDGSGSMQNTECSGGQTKITAAKVALKAFAQAVHNDANLGFAAFDNGGLNERLPLGGQNRDQFTQYVDAVNANGGTPLSKALTLGYDKLKTQAAHQLGYGEYHLVIVTDGAASSGYDPTPVVKQVINESPVLIHTIGFCIGKDHSLNQEGYTIYKTADNPEQLAQGLGNVLAESENFTIDSFSQ